MATGRKGGSVRLDFRTPEARRFALAMGLLGTLIGLPIAGCAPKEQPPAVPPKLPPMPPQPANQGGASAERYKQMMQQDGNRKVKIPASLTKQ